MARRDRRFWSKVLVGLVFALLVVDVLALTFLVVPLAASQQKRAGPPALSVRLTQSPVRQALMLPTHDPRKPWVTRTPRPTPTLWSIPTPALALQRLAAPGPGESATPVPEDAAGVGVAPDSGDVVALAALSPTATVVEPVSTPSLNLPSPQEVEPAASISPPPLSPADGGSAYTPISAGPTSTPGPIQPGDTDQPPPPITPGDAAQFGIYVRDHYNTIAGQPLEIAAVTVDTTEADRPKVVVEVLGNEANNVFAAQPAAAVLDYGRRLLDDTKFYSGGQACEIAVASIYETSNGDACTNNPTWCDLDTFDASANTWMVTWTYVRGIAVDGSDRVETWNAGR